MMKRICAAFAAVILTLALSAPALAEGESWQQGEPKLSYVTDAAGLLTASEVAELERMAAEVSETYECGVYIVTVDDYWDYGTDVRAAAETIYMDNSLGYGPEKSGTLLLLSMGDRDYSLIAYGYGNTAFTDYGKTVMEDRFLDDFADNYWYDGFYDYIEISGELLYNARNGAPVDVNDTERYEEPADPVVSVLIGLGIGCVVAGIVCGIFAAQMRSAKKQSAADEYIPSGGVELRVRQDVFTHTTQSRVRIQQENRSGGGGGTSISSSGFSGSSGKF